MKATLISIITIACLASKLIPDIARAFPLPSATNDEDIVKPVTRCDESFVDPQTIRVCEDQGVLSVSSTLRSIDVPRIEDHEARSVTRRDMHRDMHKIPDVPPTIASLLQEFIGPQIVRNIDLEPEVHEYDREPRVADFHIPLPPEDHTVVTSGSNSSERSALKEKRKILGHHIKRHLLTLLRKARQPERVTTDQVKHARIRVMQLWVLITENDLKLLGSQPLDSSLFLEGNIVGRSIGADGVVRERNNRYRDEEKKVATECFNYYKQVMTAYGFLPWYTSYEGRVGTGSNMFNILSNFFGNHLPIHPTSAPHTPK